MTALTAELIDRWADNRWRLNNLYYIVNETGRRVPFRLNSAQETLLDNMHYMNLILKARQLGFTTFIQIYMLDQCVFNSNVRAGTIAHRLDDAKAIFRDKVKYPYDAMPDQIKAAVPARIDSADVLSFENNSEIRVGTSLRSGTYHYLHISEYGKLCAQFPEKAAEVKSGALNTVHAGQIAWIESTAEGQEGHFYELCQEAQTAQRRGAKLSPLAWKFHFFPWWRDPKYVLHEPVEIAAEYERYFAGLEDKGIVLRDEQKAWYVEKAKQQGEDMKREYPSTPEEAFEASIEGTYYGPQMAKAETDGRICRLAYRPELPVHTWWDIGRRDLTAIWFMQSVGAQLHFIDYYQNSGEGLPHYAKMLQERGYIYGRHVAPHDINVGEWGTGLNRLEVADSLGIRFDVTAQTSVMDGIEAVRNMLPRCVFDAEKCDDGLKALRSYRKEWDEHRATWKTEPRHDWASHAADAMRTGAMGWWEDELEMIEESDEYMSERGRSTVSGY